MADIIIASKNAVFGQVSRSFNPECEAIIRKLAGQTEHWRYHARENADTGQVTHTPV